MRATEYIVLVVMIGVFSWLAFNGATELNEKFSDNPINTTNLTQNYDNINYINERVNSSLRNFQVLSSEDTAWYQKIGAGIVAIPVAVANFPLIVINSVALLITMLTSGLGTFVPFIILFAMLTFILIEIYKRMLEFFQRARA